MMHTPISRRPDYLYRALAAVLEKPAAELAETLAPDRARALLRYHRREACRRATAEALASALGVPVADVYLASVSDPAIVWLARPDADLDGPEQLAHMPAGA